MAETERPIYTGGACGASTRMCVGLKPEDFIRSELAGLGAQTVGILWSLACMCVYRTSLWVSHLLRKMWNYCKSK